MPVAQIPNLDATKITSGTIATARIPDLDASKITSGKVDDVLLSTNVAMLDGSPVFTSDVRLSDNDLFLRGGTDTNHGIGWFGGSGRTFAGTAIDGPVLYGYTGGALGTTKIAQGVALRWDYNGDVSFGGDATITNTLSVTSPTGVRAAIVTGKRTGDYNSAVGHFENTETGASASPALRVLGHGTAGDGALSVTANAGRIARFGNSTDWVAVLDNNGNFSATAFVTLSDRNKKAGFEPVNSEDVLTRVVALPIQTWHYTNDPAATLHMGAMAQDFHAAFGLGENEKTIATVDADGVAFAAIQGLNHKVDLLTADLSVQRSENAALRGEFDEIRILVLQLQRQLNGGRP